MNIVDPSYVIEYLPENVLEEIERAARVCYKSEERITAGSAEKFVRALLSRRPAHLSVIEHLSMRVRFICARGVTHELVRHRLCSFSQECVSGDTELRKGLTIKDLYDRTKTCYGKTHNKTISLRSASSDGTIIRNKINHVFYKGVAPVYELSTKLGYKIKATENHEFFVSNDRSVCLKDLSVGDRVLVNGRPSLIMKHKEYASIVTDYVYGGLSPNDLSDKYSIPYGSITRHFKELGIFVPRLNDNNKEKYNKNHTPLSYKKAGETAKRQYANGRVVWNKNLKEDQSPSVKRQADNLRKNHHNNGRGAASSAWAGGVSPSYYLSIKEKTTCELCGDQAVEIHHLDKNRRNNELSNLISVCLNCHKKLHHGWYIGTKAHVDEIVSIEYAGVEDVYDLEMQGPHNYVANGFIVHNSSRFVDYGNRGVNTIRPRFPEDSEEYRICIENRKHCEESYQKLRSLGVPPEIARDELPIGTKTEIVHTANLREWGHIFLQRTSPKAHPAMRELMTALLIEVKSRIPILYEDLSIY